MARVPEYTPQERIRSGFIQKSSVQTNSGAFGAGSGQATQTLGDGIVNVSDALILREQIKANADALSAYNNYRSNLSEVRTGYLSRTGENGLNIKEESDQEFSKIRQQFTQGLSGRALRLFNERADNLDFQSQSMILNHEAAQTRSYIVDQHTASIASFVEDAAAFSNDEESFNENLQLAIDQQRQLSALEGSSPEATQQAIDKLISTAVRARVELQIENDPIAANDIFNRYRDKLKVADKYYLEKRLEPLVLNQKAQDFVDLYNNSGVSLRNFPPGVSGGDRDNARRDAIDLPGDGVTVDFNLEGKKRADRPNQEIVDSIAGAVKKVFGEGSRIVVYSGTEGKDQPQYGSNRHMTGAAADFYIVKPDGKKVDVESSEAAAFMRAAAEAGVLGIGAGKEYMGPHGFHMDGVNPGKGQAHTWGSIGKRMRGELENIMKIASFIPEADSPFVQSYMRGFNKGDASRQLLASESFDQEPLTSKASGQEPLMSRASGLKIDSAEFLKRLSEAPLVPGGGDPIAFAGLDSAGFFNELNNMLPEDVEDSVTNKNIFNSLGTDIGRALIDAVTVNPARAVASVLNENVMRANPKFAGMTVGEVADTISVAVGDNPQVQAGGVFFDVQAAYQAGLAIEDPKLQARVFEQIIVRMALQERINNFDRAQAQKQAWDDYVRTGEIPTDQSLIMRMGRNGYQTFLEATKKDQTGSLETDVDTWDMLTKLSINDKKAFANVNLTAHYAALSEKDRRHFVELQQQIAAGLRGDPVDINYSEAISIGEKIYQMKIDNERIGGMNSTQLQKYKMFQDRLLEFVKDFATRENRSPSYPEIRSFADTLTNKTYHAYWLLPGSDRYLFEELSGQPEDNTDLVVTPSLDSISSIDVERITVDLAARGIEVTDDRIQEQYGNEQMMDLGFPPPNVDIDDVPDDVIEYLMNDDPNITDDEIVERFRAYMLKNHNKKGS
jgi:hypothetical protein